MYNIAQAVNSGERRWTMENKTENESEHKNVDMPGVGTTQSQSAAVIMADRNKITLEPLK